MSYFFLSLSSQLVFLIVLHLKNYRLLCCQTFLLYLLYVKINYANPNSFVVFLKFDFPVASTRCPNHSVNEMVYIDSLLKSHQTEHERKSPRLNALRDDNPGAILQSRDSGLQIFNPGKSRGNVITTGLVYK